MKLSVNSKKLAGALDSVAGALPTKHPMAILKCVLFQRSEDGLLSLVGTSFDTTIEERLEVEWLEGPPQKISRFAIPALYMRKTMQALGDVSVTLQFRDVYAVTITTDQGEYDLAGFDGGEFPAMPDLKDAQTCTVPREVLVNAVETVGFAVAKESAHVAMTGVCFQLRDESLNVVGTDSHRLVMYKLTNVPCGMNEDAVVPGPALKTLGRLSGDDACTLSITETHARFDFGTSSLTSSLIASPFPNFARILPVHHDRKITVRRESLLSTVKRTSLYAGGVGQVRIEIDGDVMKVSAEDVERAHKAFERLECDFEDMPDGDNTLTLAFACNYLEGVLQYMPSEELRFELSDPNRPSVVYPGENPENVEIKMLVMPVMLNKYA